MTPKINDSLDDLLGDLILDNPVSAHLQPQNPSVPLGTESSSDALPVVSDELSRDPSVLKAWIAHFRAALGHFIVASKQSVTGLVAFSNRHTHICVICVSPDQLMTVELRCFPLRL